jgi:hypothetical protein
MRFPKPVPAAFVISALLNVVFLAALMILLFNQRKRTEERPPELALPAKAGPAKVEPQMSGRVIRASGTLSLRIVDADREKPIGLARIVIDNGNLAPELGDDSNVVTWPDGWAKIRHSVLVWEVGHADQKTRATFSQGPWIHVSADGYEPRKQPLSALLEQEVAPRGHFREIVVRLRRGRAGGPGLAELAGDYIYGNGFVNQHLEVGRDGRYQFEWHNDVVTDEPHHGDEYEGRGWCSIVDGVLRLVPEGPTSTEQLEVMGNDFVPVRWAGRVYLIPEKERLVFCSVVNQGDVPRYMRSGPFATLSPVGRKGRPEGLPEVPPEWASFLLKKPVAGTITEILADEVAVMNVGAKDGLKAGMELVRDDRLHTSRLRVLFTESDRCFVRTIGRGAGTLPASSFAGMMGSGFLDPRPLVVGEKVLSQASDRWADE